MAPAPDGLLTAGDSVPIARAFVRSLNVLLKFARLYGLHHTRSATQFEAAWTELQEAVRTASATGLLLGASGSQLLLDGEPLESTHAERSFADLLNAASIASICFTPSVDREEFTSLVRAFMETGPKAAPLGERLEKYFGQNPRSGIRVNEIRFVAEDAAFSEARVAAQLTVKTLGGDADQVQDWFRSPEKMIQLIAAAEGSHGGPGGGGSGIGTGFETAGAAFGSGLGTGTGGDPSGAAATTGPSSGSSTGGVGSGEVGPGGGYYAATSDDVVTGGIAVAGFGGYGPANGAAAGVSGQAGNSAGPIPLPQLQEAELQSLLRLLTQFGEAANSKEFGAMDPAAWQVRLSSLPPNAQITLRQALATVAAQTPSAKVDEAMLLRLAENLAIRFALDRFQRGEVRVNAVRQMLDKMGQELDTLRKLLKAREEKMASAGLSVESHADLLDRQFWAAVPESGKRAVLTSQEAWCIPPRNVQQYVEELLGRGEAEAAGDILLKYAACVRNKDAEARKKAAIGLGQLAELYSKAANQRLQEALKQIGEQMAAEKDPELQTLLSAAFVRLSQESASRRYYHAMQQSLDSLADLEEIRPTWVQSLRPRIGVENRVPEFIEEALTSDTMPEGLIGVLMRVPQTAGEQLAVRLARSGRRTERESLVELAKTLGGACTRHLKDILKAQPPAKAANIIGLLSRLDPIALADLLPEKLRHSGRAFHDSVVRQLSIAGAPERGQLLADSIESLDTMALPLALDEIGMCGDFETSPKLLRLAKSEILPEVPDYIRVKAIEALGRMHAPAAAGHLREFVETRKAFGWAYPEEIRTAAAQALMKLDPEWMKAFLPQSGLDTKVMALAPLDPVPDKDVVRYRRYRRVRLARDVPAVVTSARGKYSSSISVLSLEGGLLSGDIQLAVGTEATLKIPAGLRSISMQAVVRFVRSHQAGFEMVGMGLDDRAKLRRLLVSLGTNLNPSGSDPGRSE
ncbi:MAG TPA: PilZ domain-containing protein [Candidatus Binatia bacterium]|nr:PilZ domain-containing protein [Candidatus Binatia bacterium]